MVESTEPEVVNYNDGPNDGGQNSRRSRYKRNKASSLNNSIERNDHDEKVENLPYRSIANTKY